MENKPKLQAIESLKEAQNVLVTVSANPSVDQLSAAIGLTLLLNKLGKHATAVFSGDVPSTIEFLKPEDTLETNTNSLRDFIISLDKSKADKLRYKVEEDVVRIFITPYKTSISDKDLDFSQGDFNVDAVVALGVDQRDHIDQAIAAHGRILHDATVISVMNGDLTAELGNINWQDKNASSLCEMVASLADALKAGVLDGQMATAFLTGIVAETDRFSNEKTSPKTMTMSAQLMAAGANQQLIASELMPEEPDPVPDNLPEPVEPTTQETPILAEPPIAQSGVLNSSAAPEIASAAQAEPIQPPPAPKQNDNEGTIQLHNAAVDAPMQEVKNKEQVNDQIRIDDQGQLLTGSELAEAVNEVRQTSAQATAQVAPGPKAAESDNLPNNQQAEPEVLEQYIETPQKNYNPVVDDSEEVVEPTEDPFSDIPSSGPMPPAYPTTAQDDLSSQMTQQGAEASQDVTDYDDKSDTPNQPPIDNQVDSPQQDIDPESAEAARQNVERAISDAVNNPGTNPPKITQSKHQYLVEELPPAVPPPLVPPFPVPEEDQQ